MVNLHFLLNNPYFVYPKSTGVSSHSSDSSKQMAKVTTLKGVAEILLSCYVVSDCFVIRQSDLYNSFTEMLHYREASV